MTEIHAIADAIVNTITAALPAAAVNVARYYQPRFDLQDLDDVVIAVVPKSETEEPAGRCGTYVDYAIDIGIQRRVDPSDRAALDEMAELVASVKALFRMKTPVGAGDVVWTALANEPIYWPELLNEKHVFLSVVTVTYRGMRLAE